MVTPETPEGGWKCERCSWPNEKDKERCILCSALHVKELASIPPGCSLSDCPICPSVDNLEKVHFIPNKKIEEKWAPNIDKNDERLGRLYAGDTESNWERPDYKYFKLFDESDLPKPTDILQTKTGDCWLLGALGALTQKHPRYIRSLIRASPKPGYYEVDLYHNGLEDLEQDDTKARAKYVRQKIEITDELPASILEVYKRSGKRYLWPAYIEKAMANLFSKSYSNLDRNSPQKAFAAFLGTAKNTTWVGKPGPIRIELATLRDEILNPFLDFKTIEPYLTEGCVMTLLMFGHVWGIIKADKDHIVLFNPHNLKKKEMNRDYLTAPYDKQENKDFRIVFEAIERGIYQLDWDQFKYHNEHISWYVHIHHVKPRGHRSRKRQNRLCRQQFRT